MVTRGAPEVTKRFTCRVTEKELVDWLLFTAVAFRFDRVDVVARLQFFIGVLV